VDVEDIILRGSWGWTIVPDRSHDVRIRNVKICNGRVQNDDGINPVNSQRVLIEDCFIRSDDDCIALKGLHGADAGYVEDIRVRNCTLWCDRARVFLLGHESRAGFMRNIAVEGVDIVHFAMTPFLLEPGEEMVLCDVRFENIRLEGRGQGSLIRLKPSVNQYMKTRVPGRIENVAFRGVGVVQGGGPEDYLIEILGHDAEHGVRGVTLDRVTVNGRAVMAGWPSLRIGAFAEGVDVRFGL
jgi:polygalacturonase